MAGATGAALLGRRTIEQRRLLQMAERSRRERPDRFTPVCRGRDQHGSRLRPSMAVSRDAVSEGRPRGDYRRGGGRRRPRRVPRRLRPGPLLRRRKRTRPGMRRCAPCSTPRQSAGRRLMRWHARRSRSSRWNRRNASSPAAMPRSPNRSSAGCEAAGAGSARMRRRRLRACSWPKAGSSRPSASSSTRSTSSRTRSPRFTTSGHSCSSPACAADAASSPMPGLATGLGARRARSAPRSREARLRSPTSVARELELASSVATSGQVLDRPSEAELAVLKLLGSDLSAREIGTTLFLSPNTIRTHTRVLYRKLGVNSRAEAVARATSLGLLEHDV